MSDLQIYLDNQLKNPKFAEEWERQRPEREYIRAIIAVRTEQNITQKEFLGKTGIRQPKISRIENGNCSPAIAALQQIADGVGKIKHSILNLGERNTT